MTIYGSDAERRRCFEAEALPHLGRVFWRARRLLGSDPEAEDLAQETFLRAYRTFDNFEPGTNALAWLFTILYSVFLNRLRRRQREPVAAPEEALEAAAARPRSGSGGWGSIAEAGSAPSLGAGVDLEAALGRLPEASRAVVLLVDVDGLSYEQAAEAMNWPVGTVRSRLSRARRRLAAELVDYAEQRDMTGSRET